MWVKILNNIELRCVRNSANNKKFRYEKKQDNEIIILSQENNSPTETTAQSALHKFLKKTLDGEVGSNHIDEEIIRIKNELENHITDDQPVNVEVDNQKQLDDKYTDLYTDFNYFLEEYKLTPLELIISVSHCLGVDSAKEIIRAFLGYFQTVIGYKGTNVIAIGLPTSGKSYVLEQALEMIPDEKIIKGVESVAYFFRKFNKKDLTGYIFYLGDIGGDKDDEETIRFRDRLKVLSTDGYIERGIINTTDEVEEEQYVEGYPGLSYSSALEETVNDQEKSRSVLLTPPPVDNGKLIVYNTVMNSKGVYYSDIEELYRVRDSIKGLVYKFNPDDYDFFNPYMFCINELISESDEFNRKIQEFEAVLKLVTLLNHPNKMEHNIYHDENYNKKETDLILASKKDNLNALNIFSSTNLLPDEIHFANGLLKSYKPFDINLIDENMLWEDNVYEWLSGDEYAVNPDNGRINIKYHPYQDKWFTLRTLKSTHRNKRWFKKSKNYINERIRKLVEENIIVNIGKDSMNNHNVYCLNQGLGDSINVKLPKFYKSDIDKATNLFKKMYPDQLNTYIDFIEKDKDYDSTSIFETVKPIKPDLPFLSGVYENL